METEYIDENAERKRKIRIVAITSILAVVILGIGAAIIVTTISKIGNNAPATKIATTGTTESTKPSNNTQASSASTAQTEPANAPASDSTEKASDTSEQESTAAKHVASTTGDIPTTGPESVVPAAIMMGIVVYLLAYNYNLTHEKIS